MTSTTETVIGTETLGPGFVADVRGVDAARIDDATFRDLVDAWGRSGVLRLRGQTLDIEAFLAFAARFGELDNAPGQPYRAEYPKLAVISNVVENGRAIGSLGSGEAKWHTDMSYNPSPPRASILYALEVPEGQGDTWFVDMERAFADLPDELRARITPLMCKHDATRNSTGELRKGFAEAYDDDERPGAVHPLVIAHPLTGRPCLFLGRRLNAVVLGMPKGESDALLDELWRRVEDSAAVWAQRWRVGDVLIWDNQRVMHRRDSFDADVRRVMHRAQIKGREPLAAAAA